MDETLKRCPFCGTRNAWLTEAGFMECGHCTSTGPADGAQGWNRRRIEDALRAERDAAVARAEAAEADRLAAEALVGRYATQAATARCDANNAEMRARRIQEELDTCRGALADVRQWWEEAEERAKNAKAAEVGVKAAYKKLREQVAAMGRPA